ncbi:MAG: cell division protein SepF [Parasporobacterium sp.]|nr:cell division protein SepF [Parasporobacterium sp.]
MGKFTDKFMNAFNGSRDDDFDDFDDDDVYEDDLIDEDDYSEPREKGGLFKKKSAPAEDRAEVRDREPAAKSTASPFGRTEKKPVPQPQPQQPAAPARNRSGAGSEVCIFKPSSIEDSREITETLLDGKAVVVNFEGLHVEISQRIIDFISGSCYALDGNLQKISNYIFIATPNSVDISGDFQDLFGNEENSFDIAGFKSPLI